MEATNGAEGRVRTAAERCWDRRRWLMWIPLAIPLLPLALGQGWIGEVVFILVLFVRPADGFSYFFPLFMDQTRMLVAFPFAVALLTPWPEWFIAALVVGCWLLLATITYAITTRLFPEDRTASVLATFLVGVTAYDTSLLHAGYVPLLVASLVHWSGLLVLLIYCGKRSMAALVGSALLQLLSLAIYATAFPAIAIGPFLAFAILASRSGYRASIRPAAAVAVAWWSPVIVYLCALAWVAKHPRSYVTAGGGLTLESPAKYLSLVTQLIANNFNPVTWLSPAPYFGNPPRLIDPALIWGFAGLAAAAMILLLVCASRAGPGRRTSQPHTARWVLASLVAAVVVSDMATALLQAASMNFRTHLVSRLYAAIIIAVLGSTYLRSTYPLVRALAVVVTFVVLLAGAWTVADRATYLASIWTRHRTELRSLDVAVRKVDPGAAIVLFEPSGAGYTATVAPWHAGPWLALIRGAALPLGKFALWSPDRGAICETRGVVLHCYGDQQRAVDIPLEQLVLLRYDVTDCRFKVVEGDWAQISPTLAPPEYAPRKWLRDQPAPASRIFEQLLYGPQGLAGNVQCG